MKSNLLYFAWRYEIYIQYKVEERQYSEYFEVITHKNYEDVLNQFTKFIMRDLISFFHGYDVVIISAKIIHLEAMNC